MMNGPGDAENTAPALTSTECDSVSAETIISMPFVALKRARRVGAWPR
jgi:hypothetical protein